MILQSHSKKLFVFLAAFLFLTCSSNEMKDTASGATAILDQLSGEPVVPRQANTLYVEPFANSSSIVGLEDKLMTRLNTLVTTDGRLAMVKSEDNADITMQGIIFSSQIQNITFNKFGQADKRRIRILATVKLTDNKKKRVIFNDPEIQAFTEFSEISSPITTEIQAIETVVDNMAKRLLSKIISGWYTDQMLNFEKGQK